MRELLFLCHRLPYPPDKGDKIRAWHMLRHLAQRHRVHLGTFVDDPADWDHVAFLRGICASVGAFGFGKAAPKQTFPALYLVGTVHGQRGIFRSIDEARTWVRINDDQHQWGLVLQIAGDPKIYGRVYVGTHGRGVFYGDPAR